MDLLPLAALGWRILSSGDEPRWVARQLCLWLAEALDTSVAGIHYCDAGSEYSWEEGVERVVDGPRGERWLRPFPKSTSYWFFRGEKGINQTHGDLLDLLAEQWTSLLGHSKPRRLRNREYAQSNSAWMAVSQASRLVLTRISQLSHSRRPLLLVGETGSGRAHLASLIRNNSPYSSDLLAESAMEGGSDVLYLPNKGSIHSLQQQVQSQGSRIIAAMEPQDDDFSLQRLWQNLTDGRGEILMVPPLRERREDIALLAGHFLELSASERGSTLFELSPLALSALRCYTWPGNVRELKECMGWVMTRFPVEQRRIGLENLPPAIRGYAREEKGNITRHLRRLESEVLQEELSRHRGNMTQVGLVLGLTPRQVAWRVQKYGINLRRFKSIHG